ncbi:MAG: effector binding domain-containing protein [Oscillospiraceae bacterium]|nr:effector binding domain-containing protein [Oscillospiraceae bacterium]
MNYEIVNLSEKTVAGYCARTNNTSPDMGQVIGGLWQKFYSDEGYLKIPNKISGKALGIYTDYAGTEKDDYTVVVAYEVSGEDVPDGFEVRKIPAGKYAKFVVRGNMTTAVQQFWQELWQMDLDRSFVCDFEEYQNSDCENAEIHIYIGVK